VKEIRKKGKKKKFAEEILKSSLEELREEKNNS